MTRTVHDQFAKQYLEELLSRVGTVETSREIAGEVRQVDVWFTPACPPPPEAVNLGLIAQMASTTCLFEPFRNPVHPVEVLECLSKLNSLRAEMRRKARREEMSLPENQWPSLWILSPSCSERLLKGFGALEDRSGKWPVGVYFLPEFFRTGLIAINALPVSPETLWLRILGRGKVQQRAIDELLALPEIDPLRRNLSELLASWYTTLKVRQNLTQDERELVMKLSDTYLRLRQEAVEEGRYQGLEEGRYQGLEEGRYQGLEEGRIETQQTMINNFLKLRFGSIDDELSAIIPFLLKLPGEELSRFLLTLSREELLQRCQEEKQ